MQNQYYQRQIPMHSNFDNTDQGTWQLPMQQQGQEDFEDTYYIDNTTNYYTYTTQPATGGGESGMESSQAGIGSGYSYRMSPTFSTGITSYNKDAVGSQVLQNTGENNQSQYLSDSQQTANNSQFSSKQTDRYVGKRTFSSHNDSNSGYYDGLYNESYMTNSDGNMEAMNSVSLGGGASSVHIGHYDSKNSIRGMSNGANNIEKDNCGNFGNTQLQNRLMAAAAGLGTWHENCGNSFGFNKVSGNFVNNKRGKRGRGFRTSMMEGQNNTAAGHNLTVNLNATNHNQWCFLRKNFSKSDNDLAEHLFDIHEKFCHHCRERIEERKFGKKKKYSHEPRAEEPLSLEKEVPDEELTEEELAVKKLMGFAGFRTTKGFRVKDNNYSAVSSLNASGCSDSTDGTTTLTEAEKKMIALRGGFSVFTKPHSSRSSSSPGFGAPAVTFDTVDGSGP